MTQVEEALRRQLGKYKFRDLTIEELKNVSKTYPSFTFSMNTYILISAFKDGSQKDLLNFSGTVPVKYGNSCNKPICLWIMDAHPFAPPICFLKPTASMGVVVGKHVDAQGETDVKSRSKTGGKNEGCFNKITVVGSGDLGIACVLAAKDVADKVVLLDLSEGAAKGGAMDLEIFAVPNVEISKARNSSVPKHFTQPVTSLSSDVIHHVPDALDGFVDIFSLR
ncbi:hypothetical protein DUI87_22763 [Hirundo rustica rustica]|uniref:UEV domain-containing protein n=1 Tax=Hirundo rustica rustica TaxID=333673 RepID=A0A3M0JGI3_HIRRU|nr:hypothetical protein DUI87_22763 [Hirundo rustica rustica]